MRIKFKDKYGEHVAEVISTNTLGYTVSHNNINEFVPLSNVISIVDSAGNQTYTTDAIIDSGMSGCVWLIVLICAVALFVAFIV